jgi:hypothetical protein
MPQRADARDHHKKKSGLSQTVVSDPRVLPRIRRAPPGSLLNALTDFAGHQTPPIRRAHILGRAAKAATRLRSLRAEEATLMFRARL